ncbi:hypothetical protein ANCDUO_08177 [Ancylostoma duodenale]|uniref:Uncharacterized protein n=1 Tax=Ancylostoma duodenale TaxID=51022 RepID=A0A0C2GWP7_9BILA|nr:hypothetical protein ANCDUO_08177 [Ancylostoma duodenale]
MLSHEHLICSGALLDSQLYIRNIEDIGEQMVGISGSREISRPGYHDDVATKYRTAYLATVFTDSFLHTLIQLALVNDPQVRLGTQQIFHTLLDR